LDLDVLACDVASKLSVQSFEQAVHAIAVLATHDLDPTIWEVSNEAFEMEAGCNVSCGGSKAYPLNPAADEHAHCLAGHRITFSFHVKPESSVMVQKRLGRGLEFLLSGGERNESLTSPVQEIEIDRILPNPHQPRETFESEPLDELRKSIERHGVLQPVVVRKVGDQFHLIAGERRWRACRDLGLKTIPAAVRDSTVEESLELALIENIQRQNLNPVEEARAYKKLVQQLGFTAEQVADQLGKSRPFVANRIRLLELEPPILDAVSRGTISAGHARALLGIKHADERRAAFAALLEGGGTVRQLESKSTTRVLRARPATRRDPNIAKLERELTDALSARVKIRVRGHRGVIQIRFEGLDDFDRLKQRLSLPLDN
jgi:ParB family chromosome partitioning protein